MHVTPHSYMSEKEGNGIASEGTFSAWYRHNFMITKTQGIITARNCYLVRDSGMSINVLGIQCNIKER